MDKKIVILLVVVMAVLFLVGCAPKDKGGVTVRVGGELVEEGETPETSADDESGQIGFGDGERGKRPSN